MKSALGLTTQRAQQLLKEKGKNTLAKKKKTSPIKIFAGQFRDVMVMILMAATVVSVVMGEIYDAITILVIVILNAVLGFTQEYRSEKTLEALKQYAAPAAKAYRDGELQNIPADDLVAGDVIKLEAGDRVPADAKILSSMACECDESILTGESIPVSKFKANTEGNALNQSGVVYMGTTLTKGHCIAQVIATGKDNQVGLVSDMLSEIQEEKTPLQKRLGELGKIIGALCVAVCILVSVAGIFRGYELFDMLLTGISLAVASIPEGLPATVTIALALAVRRIYKQKALVNKLHSVETLGCANVICTDKTGTLTKNQMTLTELYTYRETINFTKQTVSSAASKLLLACGALCNNAVLNSDGSTVGDPTEAALLVAAKTAGADTTGYERVAEIPFDAANRYMEVTVCRGNNRLRFMKGAPDVVLASCTTFLTPNGVQPLTPEDRRRFLEACDEMTSRALRLLGFSYAKEGEKHCFLGIAGLHDPLRPEVPNAVKRCKKAGIRVIMLTGDHKNTAIQIATQAGILEKNGIALTGEDLKSMSDKELKEKVRKVNVFSRVSPSDKLRIVRALKQNNDTVAMTGDGVNDAPAVKEAAIGVAMGITGTDVTKEAAKIVLLDDNFATLVATVEQGRTVYNNIRKFIRYMLSSNIGEVLTMLMGMLLNLPVILLPIQLLLVNLVTDGLPAIALGMEPATADIMKQPPRKADESIFANGLLGQILFRGVIITVMALLSFVFVMQNFNVRQAGTAALFTLAFSQLLFVFECKNPKRTLFTAQYKNNPKLILAVLASVLVLLLAIGTDVGNLLFETEKLSPQAFVISIGLAVVYPIIRALVSLLFGEKTED